MDVSTRPKGTHDQPCAQIHPDARRRALRVEILWLPVRLVARGWRPYLLSCFGPQLSYASCLEWVIFDQTVGRPVRPDLGDKQTEFGKKPTSPRECRLLREQ